MQSHETGPQLLKVRARVFFSAAIFCSLLRQVRHLFRVVEGKACQRTKLLVHNPLNLRLIFHGFYTSLRDESVFPKRHPIEISVMQT